MQDVKLSWPPEYVVRRHRRAKNVVIRATRKKTLIITIPHRYALKHLPDVIEESKSWILSQFAKMPKQIDESVPEVISLKGGDACWKIKRTDVGGLPRLYENLVGEVVLLGKYDDALFKKCLTRWVSKKAESMLTSMMYEVSQQTGLTYNKLSFRMKRTQWGSCSSKKEISLNTKLIFLPDKLIKHIMIHELCHTVHHNHSKLFWDLVAAHDPNWREHKELLKKSDKYIPAWLETH